MQLRHTYLRVLHPLLTKTQLRTMPYKRPQIVRVLESLIEHEKIRDVNPTTKRLVQRCLSGDWCVQFRKTGSGSSDKSDERRVHSPGFDAVSVTSAPQPSSSRLEPSLSEDKAKGKTLKSSRSAENLKSKPHKHRPEQLRESFNHHGNASSASLPRVAAAAVPSPTLAAPRPRRDRAESVNEIAHTSMQERKPSLLDETTAFTAEPEDPSDAIHAPAIRVSSASAGSLDVSESPRSSTPTHQYPHSAPHSPVPRRSAPPPPKRRKPPAVPTPAARAGTTMTGLTSSASQPVLSPLGSEARKAVPY